MNASVVADDELRGPEDSNDRHECEDQDENDFAEWDWRLQGQVCIASRGKVKKLCMEVKAGTSADVSIRALRGSGGLKSP